LYTTGATVFGSHNLLDWDGPEENITLSSLSVGIEETAVQDLASPLKGPALFSALGDIGGFVHWDVTKAPDSSYRPWATNSQIDYAGAVTPGKVARAHTNVVLSSDDGATWTEIPGTPGGNGRSLSISADGKNVNWFVNGGLYRSTNGAAWTTTSGGPTEGILAADKVNGTLIYAVSGSSFYLSTDSGAVFKRVGAFSTTANSVSGVAVNPFKSGDVWVAADDGVYHSVYPFTSWTKASDIQRATSISVGAPSSAQANPAVYIVGYATSSWTQGVYRSEDQGKNWVKLNDSAKNGFGSAGNNPISGKSSRPLVLRINRLSNIIQRILRSMVDCILVPMDVVSSTEILPAKSLYSRLSPQSVGWVSKSDKVVQKLHLYSVCQIHSFSPVHDPLTLGVL
jgi:xyloglucan-specific exo-beta-1,4-glucanase